MSFFPKISQRFGNLMCFSLQVKGLGDTTEFDMIQTVILTHRYSVTGINVDIQRVTC